LEEEQVFMRVGAQLGGASAGFAALTETFESLPVALESPSLAEAADRMKRVARTNEAMGRALDGESAVLHELVVLNREVSVLLAQLHTNVRTVSILSLNAKIEAAGIDGKGNDFINFTQEMAQLAQTAQATIDTFRHEHEKLVTLLDAASKAQTTFQKSYGRSLFSIAQGLDASLLAVDARRRQAGLAAVEIGKRSRQITGAIGSAICALQIADTTRQRIEHVHDALCLLLRGIKFEPAASTGSAELWSQTLNTSERENLIAFICRLQSAQIEDVLREYEDQVRVIFASLTQLAEESRSVVREGSQIFGSSDQDSGSFMAQLKRELRLGVELMRDCQAARACVDTATLTVARTATQLQQRVSAIGQIVLDMTLVGLNAALKSRQIGAKGRGLGIIADELRLSAAKTVKDADILMPALDRIIGAARKFEKIRSVQGAERMLELDEDLAMALVVFDRSAASLSAAFADLVKTGSKVSGILDDCTSELADHGDTQSILQQGGAELACLADMFASGPPSADVASHPMSELEKNYTMASERRIHAQFAITVIKQLPGKSDNLLDDRLYA
jgi:hypothetical protein